MKNAKRGQVAIVVGSVVSIVLVFFISSFFVSATLFEIFSRTSESSLFYSYAEGFCKDGTLVIYSGDSATKIQITKNLIKQCSSNCITKWYGKVCGVKNLEWGKAENIALTIATTTTITREVSVEAVLQGIRWVETKCGNDATFKEQQKTRPNNLLDKEYGEFQIKYTPAIVQLKNNYNSNPKLHADADPAIWLAGIDKTFPEPCATRISSTWPGINLKKYKINYQCARAYLVYLLKIRNYDIEEAIHRGWNPNSEFTQKVYGAMVLNNFNSANCDTLWRGYTSKPKIVPENGELGDYIESNVHYVINQDGLFLSTGITLFSETTTIVLPTTNTPVPIETTRGN